MALGFLNKQKNVASDSPPLPNAPVTEKPMMGNEGYGAESSDPESLGGERRMSRIDRAVSKPIVGDTDADDSSGSGISVGKQMELEAGNAIKYRTCSWPKV